MKFLIYRHIITWVCCVTSVPCFGFLYHVSVYPDYAFEYPNIPMDSNMC